MLSHQNRTRIIGIYVFLLLPVATARAQQQAPINCKGPLSEEQLIGLLKGGVADVRVQAFVDKCGIGFILTPVVERKLLRAQASDDVIAAIKVRSSKKRLAADVDGKWVGTIPGLDIPVSYTFKADGATLTGTSSGRDNTTIPIKNGKIEGNNISFRVTFDIDGQETKLDYKGVVSVDQIKLSFDMMGQTTEILLKQAK